MWRQKLRSSIWPTETKKIAVRGPRAAGNEAGLLDVLVGMLHAVVSAKRNKAASTPESAATGHWAWWPHHTRSPQEGGTWQPGGGEAEECPSS